MSQRRCLSTLTVAVLLLAAFDPAFGQPRRLDRSLNSDIPEPTRGVTPVPGSEYDNPAEDPMFRAWSVLTGIGVRQVCLSCGGRAPVASGAEVIQRLGFDADTAGLLFRHIEDSMFRIGAVGAERDYRLCQDRSLVSTRDDLAAYSAETSRLWQEEIRVSFERWWEMVGENGRQKLAKLPDRVLAFRSSSDPVDVSSLFERVERPVQETLDESCARMGY